MFACARILALSITLAVAIPGGVAEANPRGAPIDIWNHSGGNVLQTVRQREELGRSGREVRIRGYCRSACTMLISLPNACLGPRARIGFHAPRLPGTTVIPPYVDQIMGQYYRGGIRERWFGGWNRSHQMNVITARDFVRLDPQARICSGLGR